MSGPDESPALTALATAISAMTKEFSENHRRELERHDTQLSSQQEEITGLSRGFAKYTADASAMQNKLLSMMENLAAETRRESARLHEVVGEIKAASRNVTDKTNGLDALGDQQRKHNQQISELYEFKHKQAMAELAHEAKMKEMDQNFAFKQLELTHKIEKIVSDREREARDAAADRARELADATAKADAQNTRITSLEASALEFTKVRSNFIFLKGIGAAVIGIAGLTGTIIGIIYAVK